MNATAAPSISTAAAKALRAIIKAILGLARGVIKVARYIFGIERAEQKRRALDATLDAQDAERERTLSQADAMLREAARLDRERAEKTSRAADAAHSEMRAFRIKSMKLAPDASAVLIRLEADGHKFTWRAPLDENCRLVIDEEMPEELVNAIRKTDDPAATLETLGKMIQGQVDRLMREMHDAAKRRRDAERDIVEIVPPSGRVEYAK